MSLLIIQPKNLPATLYRRAHDRFLLRLLLGEKVAMRASSFLRHRRHIKSVRRNLSCSYMVDSKERRFTAKYWSDMVCFQ
jgi:predicted acyltransferase